MAEGLRVRLLGPLQVTVAGTKVGPGGALRRSLLALLALHPGEVRSADALVDGIWGERPPESAPGVLQTYVSTWRKALTEAGDGAARITTVGHGYRLDLAEDESDLLRFGRLVADGRRMASQGRAGEAREALDQALRLWRGQPLADLSDRPFHPAAVGPLEEARDQAVEDWAEMVLRTGTDDDLPAVATALHRLRDASPWRERTTELLMWALFRQSRQREALALFDQTQERLAEELGADPGQALRTMHSRVLRQDPVLTGPPRAARRRPPARLDSFVGREDDVRAAVSLLTSARMVTLTGPGGSGKTRLAEVVADAYGTAADIDVAVVELASVEEAARVPGMIAARLDIAPADTLEALVPKLAERTVLVVLDNLEQIPAVGAVVTGLLTGAAGVRVLATSREPLHVPGEQRYPVEPLRLPPHGEIDLRVLASAPSVALLLDRARAADPQMVLTAGNAAAVRDIVRGLDGLPLALEIVAPWLSVLTPAGLLAELRHPLDLRARRPDADSRHRSLRTAIAWSHDRLTASQQRLLARLSVLVGGAGLDAILALGDDLDAAALEILMDLVDRHLVQRAEPVDGTPRFRLLETVREFAAERLADSGEQPAVERRAADWYAAWAAGCAARCQGPGSEGWIARVVADADNLRAAIDLLDREARSAEHLQLVVDTFPLWWHAGHEREGERRLRHALDVAPPAVTPTRALGMAYLAWMTGTHDSSRSEPLAREAVRLAREAGDVLVLCFALLVLGDVCFSSFEEPQDALLEAAALAERARDRPVRAAPTAPDAVLAEAAACLAGLWVFRSVPRAVEWQRRALEAAERTGDRRELVNKTAVLGLVLIAGGDVAGGRPLVERAVAMLGGPARSIVDDAVPYAHALLLHLTGEFGAAEAVMRESIGVARAGGRLHHVHQQSCLLVDLLVDRGDLAGADEALRAVEAMHAAGDDDQYLTELHARRARLQRLAGERDAAAALLEAVQKGLDPTFLRPEHVIHLVESALLAAGEDERRDHLERLEELSRATGVPVFPWERRVLQRG